MVAHASDIETVWAPVLTAVLFWTSTLSGTVPSCAESKDKRRQGWETDSVIKRLS